MPAYLKLVHDAEAKSERTMNAVEYPTGDFVTHTALWAAWRELTRLYGEELTERQAALLNACEAALGGDATDEPSKKIESMMAVMQVRS